MSHARRYRVSRILTKRCRLSSKRMMAVAMRDGDRQKLTIEQHTYQCLAKLADAITAGCVVGEFVLVKGQTKEELYAEFFGSL